MKSKKGVGRGCSRGTGKLAGRGKMGGLMVREEDVEIVFEDSYQIMVSVLMRVSGSTNRPIFRRPYH